MKSLINWIGLLHLCASGYGQSSQTPAYQNPVLIDTHYHNHVLTEFFNEENIDIYTGGFIRSTTDIFRVNIGNPHKFYLPFYLIVGTTAQLERQSSFYEKLAFELINTNGGLLNFGFAKSNNIYKKKDQVIIDLYYQMGVKSIVGLNSESLKHENFMSKILSSGIIMSTKAWSPLEESSEGQLWIKVFSSCSHTSEEKLKNYFEKNPPNLLFAGNIEMGIFIKKGLNVTGGFYKFLNHQKISALEKSIFKVASNIKF